MVKKHVVTEGCANLGIHLGIQGVEIDSGFLGHLGLVAGMCDELELVQFIDEELGLCNAHNNKVSHGERVKIMILNGLGFVSPALHMYSEYFEDKPL